MMWWTLRQQRGQTRFGVAVATLGVGGLLVTGLLAHAYHNAASCVPSNCAQLAQTLQQHYGGIVGIIGPLMLVAPLMVGMFWGAPLIARELESGTFRLAWTQDVSRRKWLAWKVGSAAALSVAVVGALSAAVTWWAGPLDAVVGDSRFAYFDTRGAAPVGYALFALAVGTAAGLLTKRTVPAMVITIITFTTVRLTVYNFVRPHITAAVRLSGRIAPAGKMLDVPTPSTPPGAWFLTSTTVDNAGHVLATNGFGPQNLATPCHLATNSSDLAGFAACANRLGVHTVVQYQPAGHYWETQALETGLFAALAVLLFTACLRRISRDATP